MTGVTDPGEVYFKDGIWVWFVDQWIQALGDAAGHLQVDVVTSGLAAGTHNIYNVTMTLANTEYSRALPANTRKFAIKCRTYYDVKLCFTAGQSNVTYITIPAGMTYWDDLINPATLTLYFQCPTAAQVAEIVAWS